MVESQKIRAKSRFGEDGFRSEIAEPLGFGAPSVTHRETNQATVVMRQTNATDVVDDNRLGYYGFVRKEIAPLLPSKAERILEVGAASGGTLNWLKQQFPGAVTTAVERNEELRVALNKNVDKTLIGPIEDVVAELETYDLILLLDVLEHLDEPDKLLRQLHTKLDNDGVIIVSIPNVAHLSVSLPLLFLRKFEYQDAGILDRTHKRFFTDASAVALLNSTGFRVSKGIMLGIKGRKAKFIDLISFGLIKHHLTKQYAMCAEKVPTDCKQTDMRWMGNV